MRKVRKFKKCCVGAVILLIATAFLPLGQSEFFLPPWGGGMVHCDPQMSDDGKPV